MKTQLFYILIISLCAPLTNIYCRSGQQQAMLEQEQEWEQQRRQQQAMLEQERQRQQARLEQAMLEQQERQRQQARLEQQREQEWRLEQARLEQEWRLEQQRQQELEEEAYRPMLTQDQKFWLMQWKFARKG